jgi:hypothetical protein
VIRDEGLQLLSRGEWNRVHICVMYPNIITMMQMYSNSCNDQIHREYQFGGIGDSIKFFPYSGDIRGGKITTTLLVKSNILQWHPIEGLIIGVEHVNQRLLHLSIHLTMAMEFYLSC